MDTKSLHFDSTITAWDEALPLGNGDIGCLIWNSSDRLRFSLDKGGIWDCSNPPESQKNFTYADMLDSVKRNKQGKIYKKYDACYHKPTPTKLPAGKLILDLGIRENIVSHLDFASAQAELQAGDIYVKSFVHAAENYGLIEINKTDVTLTVDNPKYGKKRKPLFQPFSSGTVQTLKNLHYPNAEFFNEAENGIQYQYFVQPTNDRFYGIVTAKQEQDGKTLIAYTVGVGKSRDFVNKCKKTVFSALQTGYKNALISHKEWWAQYWEKSQITLPDKLLEKQWYLNNYLLGACSRKGFFPMPLQGVWTADNGSLPPWKGDYHHDLNTQMSYTSYLKANRLEQGECFIDYLLDLADAGRRFAKNFYDAEGLCLPSVMDIEGHALGGWCQYSLSPVNQLWLCQIMARYCYFTNDRAYTEKVYAYMQEVGKFLLCMLTEKNGVYKLPLSTSPEIHDNTRKAWLTPNSNYDLALMRNFTEDMIRMSRIQGDTETAEEWERHLQKFEPLAVNEKGVLMLCPDESPYCSHRHHSHCMSIYPLKNLEYTTDENRRIINNTIKDLEKHGIGEWVGYSVGWMAQLYIAQGNGDKAAEMLQNFFKYNCTDNGFHINGDFKKKTDFHMKYRLFTLEGNFIATDAVQDMLLYSEWGKIRLFPAIPKTWEDAEFENFRAFGGLLISCKLKMGEIVFLKITATADAEFSLENDLSHLTPDKSIESTQKIVLKKGETLIFE
ncbi:MAG: glycoside hydrolase N-terminal domain-containing protein [Clostridia bacterium]|nr:glycoside hydrolase N-terminal domain-containing protein [Clostridia bacterium]